MKKKLFISSSKLFSFSRYFIFVLTLWSCRKNSVIRKISLSSRFIAPQPGYQTITIHILSNIDELKTNQAMKFDQFIEYKRRNILIQNSCRKWDGKTSSGPRFWYQVVYSVGLQLNIFQYPSAWHTVKTNCIKLLVIDPEICAILIF